MKRITLLFVTLVLVLVLAICTRLYASDDNETFLFDTIAESQKDLRLAVDSLEKMEMKWEKKSRLHDKLTDAQRVLQDAQELLMVKK